MKQLALLKFVILLFSVTAIFIFSFAGGNEPINKTSDATFVQQIGGTDWTAPKTADKLKNPFEGNASATKDGKTLFKTYCAACHGDKGVGNGAAASALNPKPKNLTAEKVQEQTDGAIFWKIANGKGQMVSWQSTLNEKQRWALVNFIRQLKKSK